LVYGTGKGTSGNLLMSSFGGCNVKVVYDGLDKDNENSIYKLILEV